MAVTGTALAQRHLSGYVQAWLSRLRLTYILHIHKRHGSENNNNILSGVGCYNEMNPYPYYYSPSLFVFNGTITNASTFHRFR